MYGVICDLQGQNGGVVVAAPNFANCWAEVWCGSPEYGRWVHADVIGVEVDRCVCLSMRMLACLCVAVLSTDAGCTWM